MCLAARSGSAVSLLVAAFPYALCANPEAAGALYAGLGDGGILFSTDAGGSWSDAARVPVGLQALAAVAA